MPSPTRALELYCGIGGFAAASAGRVEVVAAVDIHRGALDVYRHNFAHPTVAATLESLTADRLAAWDADLWWLSPPCQPFTRRGLRRDDADPRARSLLHLIGLLRRTPPRLLALENVPGFRRSRTRTLLIEALVEAGYEVREQILCPSRLGLPNRRERYYLAASREGLRDAGPPRMERRSLRELLDDPPEAGLAVDPDLAARYRHALDVVRADDPEAVAACFTSAYGRSPVRSGSYLATPDGGLRRFSPREVLRLLGFPSDFELPSGLTRSQAWRLVGNSLSVPAVRRVLEALPGCDAGSSA